MKNFLKIFLVLLIILPVSKSYAQGTRNQENQLSAYISELTKQLRAGTRNVIIGEPHATIDGKFDDSSEKHIRQLEQAIIESAKQGSRGHLLSLEFFDSLTDKNDFSFSDAYMNSTSKEEFMQKLRQELQVAREDGQIDDANSKRLEDTYSAIYDLRKTAEENGSNVILHDNFRDSDTPGTDDTDEFRYIQESAKKLNTEGSIIVLQGIGHLNNHEGLDVPNYDDLARRAGQDVTTMIYMSPELLEKNLDIARKAVQDGGAEKEALKILLDMIDGKQRPDISIYGNDVQGPNDPSGARYYFSQQSGVNIDALPKLPALKPTLKPLPPLSPQPLPTLQDLQPLSNQVTQNPLSQGGTNASSGIGIHSILNKFISLGAGANSVDTRRNLSFSNSGVTQVQPFSFLQTAATPGSASRYSNSNADYSGQRYRGGGMADGFSLSHGNGGSGGGLGALSILRDATDGNGTFMGQQTGNFFQGNLNFSNVNAGSALGLKGGITSSSSTSSPNNSSGGITSAGGGSSTPSSSSSSSGGALPSAIGTGPR